MRVIHKRLSSKEQNQDPAHAWGIHLVGTEGTTSDGYGQVGEPSKEPCLGSGPCCPGNGTAKRGGKSILSTCCVEHDGGALTHRILF